MHCWVLQFVLSVPLLVLATTSCEPGDNGDEQCKRKYSEGSYCLKEEKMCSNPFASGCLHYHNKTKYDKRICNSDDIPGSIDCTTPSEFDYQEVRILIQNWDSPIFAALVMQIFLSEMLGVPSTIEMSRPDGAFNFYERTLSSDMPYGESEYDYDALRMATEHGDCRKVTREEYKSCAHVMPEIWSGQKDNLRKFAKVEFGGYSTGWVGKYSWYIPAFTAREYSFLQSYFELSGNKTSLPSADIHRRLFSRFFERPRTWKEYCAEFTIDNCQHPPYFDKENRTIATRAPNGTKEETSYFKEGLFHGHFSPSEENNCTAKPDTCTGHMSNGPCWWTTFVWQQAHHLNIPVSGNGQIDHGGYNHSSLEEIWDAANYTKSHVLFYWYTPSRLVSKFIGTEFEFVPIHMPPSTKECTEHRLTEEERCSEEVVYGSPIGACDSEAQVIQKLISPSLNDFHKDIAFQSPAYEALLNLQFSELDIEYVFRQWYKKDNYNSSYVYREAICEWAFDNLHLLQTFVPPTYPRIIIGASKQSNILACVAIALSAAVLVLVLLTAFCVYHYREKKVIKHSQPMFLYLLLAGLVLMTIGAILYGIPPSKGICISRTWLNYLGFTLAFVPVIVKVAAINTLMKNAKKMKRVTIERSKMYIIIGVFLFFTIIYLICWTTVGMLSAFENSLMLSQERNDLGGNYVYTTASCGDSNSIWHILGNFYMLFVMVVAIVLAFQTRHAQQEFNESVRLAVMVYSYFLFFSLRFIVMLFESEGVIDSHVSGCIVSYLLTADIFMTLLIYFFPKLLEARWPEKKYKSPYASMIATYKATAGSFEKLVRVISKRNVTQKDPRDSRKVNFAKDLTKFQELPEETTTNFESNESDIVTLEEEIAQCRRKLAALESELHIAESNNLDKCHQHNAKDDGARPERNEIQYSLENDRNIVGNNSNFFFEQYHGNLTQIESEEESDSQAHPDNDDKGLKSHQTYTNEEVSASSLVEKISLEILETGTILSSSTGDNAIKWSDDEDFQKPMKPSRK